MAKNKSKSKKSKKAKNQVSFTHTEAQNAAKTLFANIRFISVDNPIRSIAITSSVPNEGKSTVSVYLAQAIATAGHKVLIVESDMRRRSIARMLGVQSHAGLYSVLTGAATLQSAVVKAPLSSAGTLDFLDVEPGIPNPPDILASNRFREFVREAQSLYDYVVFDTPPVCAFVDGAVLSAVVDATILVVKTGEVKRANLMDAFEQLRKSGGNVIGAVANFVEESKSEYYYAYYYEDGTRSSRSRQEGIQPLPPTAPVNYAQQPAAAAPMPAQAPAAAAAPAAPAAAAAAPMNQDAGAVYTNVVSMPAAAGQAPQTSFDRAVAQQSGYPASGANWQAQGASGDVRADAQAYSRSAYTSSGKRAHGHGRASHGSHSSNTQSSKGFMKK